jgi:hypothetical protein
MCDQLLTPLPALQLHDQCDYVLNNTLALKGKVGAHEYDAVHMMILCDIL